jgi:hypothetical protein
MKLFNKTIIIISLVLTSLAFSKIAEYRPSDEVKSLTKTDATKFIEMLDSNDADLVTYLLTTKVKEIDWDKADNNELANHIDNWYRQKLDGFLIIGKQKFFAKQENNEIQIFANSKLIKQALSGVIAMLELDGNKAANLVNNVSSKLMDETDNPFNRDAMLELVETAAQYRNSQEIETSFDYIKQHFYTKLSDKVKSLIDNYYLERKYAKTNNVKDGIYLLLESIPKGLFDKGIITFASGESETKAFENVYDYKLRMAAAAEILDNDANLSFTHRVILIMLAAPNFPNSKEQAEQTYEQFQKFVGYYLKIRDDKRCSTEYKKGMDDFLSRLQQRYVLYLNISPIWQKK